MRTQFRAIASWVVISILMATAATAEPRQQPPRGKKRDHSLLGFVIGLAVSGVVERVLAPTVRAGDGGGETSPSTHPGRAARRPPRGASIPGGRRPTPPATTPPPPPRPPLRR